MTAMTAGETSTPAQPWATSDLRALGTDVRLAVTDPRRLDAALAVLVAQLDDVDSACSRFRDDSELRQLRTDGHPHPVSPVLAEAVAVALRAAELTDGDVDPTGGGELARLGYDRDFAGLPDDGPPVQVTVRPFAGWRHVRLDQERGTLAVPAGVVLDLGATAKAWAADRAASSIATGCGCGVLVSLGGDVAVAGAPPEGGWPVRVQDLPGRPDEPAEGPTASITLLTGGLATSSTAVRRWVRGGRGLHHVLDPRTGQPARTPWRTVTVAAASCTDANVASTAAVIRGQAAPAWLHSLGLPARLVARDGRVTTVGGWPAEAEGVAA